MILQRSPMYPAPAGALHARPGPRGSAAGAAPPGAPRRCAGQRRRDVATRLPWGRLGSYLTAVVKQREESEGGRRGSPGPARPPGPRGVGSAPRPSALAASHSEAGGGGGGGGAAASGYVGAAERADPEAAVRLWSSARGRARGRARRDVFQEAARRRAEIHAEGAGHPQGPTDPTQAPPRPYR